MNDRQRDERIMASRNPNPGRITTALDAAGLWGPEVDRACGVQEPTVDRWETIWVERQPAGSA